MKRALFFLFARFTQYFLSLMGENTRIAMCSLLANRANQTKVVLSRHGAIRLYSPSNLTAWRADTLFSKEPETIAWIDAMPSGATLWDIGANVGCYTMYAAKRGLHVLAFEPSHTNYSILNTNIALNGLTGQAIAYCVALSEMNGLGLLALTSLEPGGALSDFHGEASPTLTRAQGHEVVFTQGMVGFSIDALLEMPRTPFPDFIKIDVDGIELQIIKGAYNTLRDSRLQGLMIEVDEGATDNARAIVDLIEEAGMVLEGRRHGTMFETGEYSNIFNYFYVRKTG